MSGGIFLFLLQMDGIEKEGDNTFWEEYKCFWGTD
jgi:hypothetical protein